MPRLVLTGQHPDLDLHAHGIRDCPAVRLSCAGRANPHDHVRAVAAAIAPALADAPDLVLVQGDTSSALGAARAAWTAGIPVGHVEAGLRTHDRCLPWPEEQYRVAIDAQAALLFAPTELAADNLIAEQVPGDIHVTGNTGVDSLLRVLATVPPAPRRRTGYPRILVTCHRRESWGDGLRSVAAAAIALAAARDARIAFVLHPNPHVAAEIRAILDGQINIRLLEQLGHRELVAAMRNSDLVLSDSGGVQEEAPTIGVPLLVLREKTERPEALATGNMRLVGTDTRRIVDGVRALLADRAARAAMARPAFPYGDGHAAPRIAAITADWLAARDRRRLRRA